MQCKKCGLELEQNQPVCPNCGENTEAEVVVIEQMQELNVDEVVTEEKSGQKTASGKNQTLKAVVFAVLAAALLVALAFIVIMGSEGGMEVLFPTKITEPTIPTGTIPQDGNPDDETCKGSYTQSDEILAGKRDTVVAQLGDMTLTNGQLQVYYWVEVANFAQTNGALAGPNFNMALDQQLYDTETGMSWQQHFLKEALDQWVYEAVLCQEADKAGIKMTEERQTVLDGMRADLEKKYVETGEYADLDEYVRADMGAGCSYSDYEDYWYNRYYSVSYYEHLLEEVELSMEDIEAFFEAKKEELVEEGITKDSGKMIDFRHIMIAVKKENADAESFDEEDWERCRQEAQALYDQWLAGDADEASFEALAKLHSADTESNKNGGLYRYIEKGETEKELEEWCFDESRKEGDSGLVKSGYGYHIMYYVYGDETWIRYSEVYAPYWVVDNQLQETITAVNPEIRYVDMGLWYWIVA